MEKTTNMKDKVEDIKENSKEIGSVVKDNVLEVGRALKEQAANSGQEVYARVSEVRDDAVEWVKDNPLKTVGMTVGMAFCAGWVFSKL